VGDYVSVCLPSLSRDRIIIKPEMTVLTGIWKWHRWFLWMYH